jgi:large exoprotein involved in heme utilization and adhesion
VRGDGGDITIQAGGDVTLESSSLLFQSRKGSDIEITTSSLTLSNSASLFTSTNGEGNGGSIQVNASDFVVLNENSTLNSAALEDSTGEPGNIEVKTRSLLVNNDAQVTVESQGEGSGGNLFIEADSLTLDRNGSINASTISGTGGNITLLADILSLRNNSNISAQALEDANGGNITTDADLIIAFPNQNNDIFANAAQGNGGNINITTQGIFGLEERPSTPPNQTNDIDASSEFGLQGTFSLNTPDFDPTSGLIELPQAVGDVSDQISQNPCEQGVGSEFIITGKGGLPPNVNESLNSESAQVGLIETVPSQQQIVGENDIHSNPAATSEPVPAQGWVFNDKGEVTLTAYSTSANKIQRSKQQHHNACSSGIVP